MKLEQVLFPIIFFLIVCPAAALLSGVFLRSRGIHVPPLAKGLMWSGTIVAIVSLSSLVIVSVYQLGTPGEIFVGVLFVCLSAFSGAFVYLRYRNK